MNTHFDNIEYKPFYNDDESVQNSSSPSTPTPTNFIDESVYASAISYNSLSNDITTNTINTINTDNTDISISDAYLNASTETIRDSDIHTHIEPYNASPIISNVSGLNSVKYANYNTIDKDNTTNFYDRTIYQQPTTKEDKNRKYVDKNLNSYLDINDLEQRAQENVDICKDTLTKLYDRDTKLADLKDTTDVLSNNSSRFKSKSRSLKHRMIYNYILHILGILFFIILIILLIVKLTN